MKRGSIITVVFLLVFLLLSGPVLAAVPWLISYQGKVTDSEQVPLDGAYTMIFRLYSFEGATAPIWAEEQTVSVTDGVFQVQLGAGANIVGGDLDSTLIAGQERWLEIEIEGEALSPRQRLTSGAYALRAETADSALRISGALPSRITADDEGYALSVSNSGTGGAAELDGFVNVDHGDLLVQGDGSFDAGGEEGTLYLGDTYNYIKAIRDFGVSIGTFDADDALVVQAGTGNVGIGVTNPTGGKLDVNGLISSRGTGLDCGVRMANPVGNRDYRMIQKDDGRLTITDETAHVERIIMDENGNIGIGTSPSQQLSVYGTIESKGGGFKFPDGSSQTSAGATQVYVSALEARIASLETKMAAMEALLANVTRTGNEITFSGVNVHINNGTGTTDGEPNTYGNLIVGYNEIRTDDVNFRSGSHNIIVGVKHNYSSYGGLATGLYNTISGDYSSVTGGTGNTASKFGASVSGGNKNNASGIFSSISGGFLNNSPGNYTTISGGSHNESQGVCASVGGGFSNIAHGKGSFVGGGGGEATEDGNVAFSHFSTIVGGTGNLVGDPNLIQNYIGFCGTIAGGESNRASGDWSSITGGLGNTTDSNHANVTGGAYNTAVNSYATVSGGYYNTASGASSTVSGGHDNTAANAFDSVVGDVGAVYVDNTPVH